MEEKLSTIYLVNGQTALQYLMNVSKKYRQIATEAIFECLRLGYPLNDMEISGKARELLRKRNVMGKTIFSNFLQTEAKGVRTNLLVPMLEQSYTI